MDPETASIRSEAPSYSAAPPPRYSQVVPPPHYSPPAPASGSSPRYSSLLSDANTAGRPNRLPHAVDVMINPGTHSYLTDISPAGRPMQSAMYQRVAARRAAKPKYTHGHGHGRTASFAGCGGPGTIPEERPVQRRRGLSEPNVSLQGGQEHEELEQEQEYEEYREEEVANAVDDMEAALAQESKEWDFMLGQMKDWEDRERRWNRFKENSLQTRGWKGLAKGLRQG